MKSFKWLDYLTLGTGARSNRGCFFSAWDGESDIEISCAYELGRFAGTIREHTDHEFERMSNQGYKSRR